MKDEKRLKEDLIVELKQLRKRVSKLEADKIKRKHVKEALRESEEKYRNLIENTKDSIVIIDLKGNVLFGNKASEQLTGYSLEEGIGINSRKVTPLRYWPRSLAALRKAKKGLPIPYFETMIKRKDGKLVHVESGGQAIFKDGKVVGVQIITRDISDRIRAEEALRESEERFRGFAEKSFDIIYMIDFDGNFTYISPSVVRLLGSKPEKATGKSFKDFLPESEIPKVRHALEELGKGKDIKGLELEIFGKDQQRFHIQINSTPIYKNKKIIGLQGIARDITERKRSEKEIKRRLMKFNLDEGNVYLIKETTSTQSIEAVKELIKVGYSGLVISRTPVKDFKKLVDGELEFLWLSDKKGENTFPPVLKKIELRIEKLPRQKIVLIDRLDYLISKHSFKKVLSFVQHLRELALISNYIIILSIDPTTLSAQEVRLLEKEALEVQPSKISILPEHLLEILKFIYNQNIIGIKPSHRNICKELHLSKPTIKKRLLLLTSGGYIIENVKGREKVLELTEQGKTIFS